MPVLTNEKYDDAKRVEADSIKVDSELNIGIDPKERGERWSTVAEWVTETYALILLFLVFILLATYALYEPGYRAGAKPMDQIRTTAGLGFE